MARYRLNGTPMEVVASNNKWGRHVVLLILLGLCTLVPGTFTMPLVDRDEPRFAQATQEMMNRSDWIIPTFNDEYRFDKPPLTYWTMSASYFVFGRTEFSARLHSVLFAILAAAGIYGFGRRMFSATSGLLAGAAFLTSFQVLIHGRVAVADMPMIAAMVFTMWALWEQLRPYRKRSFQPFDKWFWILWLSQAAGFLAKGPVALLVPILAVVLARVLFWREGMPWQRLQTIPGVIIMLLPIAAWGIPALLETKGEFWSVGIGKHVVERGFEPFNSRLYIPGLYYLCTAFISLFPWSAYLLTLFRRRRKSETPESGSRAIQARFSRRFLWAWFAAPFLIFAFYKTQLPHYILPGFGAFFLLLFAKGWPRIDTIFARINYHIVFGAASVLIGFILYVISVHDYSGEARDLLLVLGFAAILVTGLTILGLRAPAGHWRWISFTSICLVIIGGFGVGKSLQRTALVHKLEPIFAEMAPDAAYHGWAFSEPGLVFYSQALWTFHDDDEIEELRRIMLETEGPALIVCLISEYQLDDSLEALIAGKTPAKVSKRHASDLATLPIANWDYQYVSGINYARTSWAKVMVLIRE